MNHRLLPDVEIIAEQRFTQHQGHNLLALKLQQRGYRCTGWSGSLVQKATAKVLRRLPAFRGLNPTTAFNVWRGNRISARRRPRWVHFIWGDDELSHLKHPEGCILTLHQPMELWTTATWQQIARSGGIICMSDRERVAINIRCPHIPCVFIPHGIDIDFWQPANPPPLRRLCAVGRSMRNVPMLLRVAREILQRHPDVTFQWLIHPDYTVRPELVRELPPERFELVHAYSDQQLRALYAESWAFCMPYDNVTASNAIVECMASGTPIFTTRTGGMASYGEDVMTLVENNDAAGMVEALSACLASGTLRADQARRGRRYAVEHFAWPQVLDQHERFYASLPRAEAA
jgi:glycosyltransferase involved in cell wall biosynthesis